MPKILNTERVGLIAGKSGDSLTDRLHEHGYKVALVAGRPGEPGTDLADDYFVKDLRFHEEIFQFFRELKVQYFVVGTGDRTAFQLVQYLEDRGMVCNLDDDMYLLLKDKIKTKQVFETLGIKTPKWMSFDTYPKLSHIVEQLGIPCVVKSAVDAVQPQKANSELELEEAIQDVWKTGTKILVEEFIQGGDCTYAVASDGENIQYLGPIYYSKAKEYQLKGFTGAYEAQLDAPLSNQLFPIVKRLMEHLKMTGTLRVDFMICDDAIYALEVNSVIVTGYHGSAYPFFQKQGIEIDRIMAENALRIIHHKVQTTKTIT